MPGVSENQLNTVNDKKYIKTRRSYIIDWTTAVVLLVLVICVEYETFKVKPNTFFIPGLETSTNTNIQYPYGTEILGDADAVFISIFPSLIIFITSSLILKLTDKNFTFKAVLLNFEVMFKNLILTFGLTLLITDTIKISTGIPRPYYQYSYDNNMLKNDDRYTFPSGHASLPMACNVVLTLYLLKAYQSSIHDYYNNKYYNNVNNPDSYYLYSIFYLLNEFKVLVLVIIVMSPIYISLWCGISRIVDYSHYKVDVLAGFIIGACVAFFVYNIFYDEMYGKFNKLIRKRKFDEENPNELNSL